MQGHIHSGWERLIHFSSALTSQHHSESETLKIRGFLNSKQDILHGDTGQVPLSSPVPTLLHGGGLGPHSDSLVSTWPHPGCRFHLCFWLTSQFVPQQTQLPTAAGGGVKPLERPSGFTLYLKSIQVYIPLDCEWRFLWLLSISAVNRMNRRSWASKDARSQVLSGGSQFRNSRQEPRGRDWNRDHRGVFCTELLPKACSVFFLTQPKTTCPGLAPYSVGWALPHWLSVKIQTCVQPI